MDEQNVENMWQIMKENNLELVGELKSELKCTICKKLLINACNAPCGCRFCLDCIQNYLRDGKKKCPGQSQFCDIDQIDIDTDIRINRLINIRILDLCVKCPNIDCQSPTKLNKIAEHLRICSENQFHCCPYVSFGCDKKKIGNSEVRDHLLMDIDSHSTILRNCLRNLQNETKSLKNDIKKLQEEIETNQQMRSDNERTRNIIRDLEKLEREISSEIKMLVEEMCALRNSNRDIKVELKAVKENQEHQILQYQTIIKNQNEEIFLLKTQIGHQFNDAETLNLTDVKWDEVDNQPEEIQDEEIQLEEVPTSNCPIRDDLIKRTISIQNMKEIIDKSILGEFIWRIDNLMEKVRKADICSDSFMSHKNGYKICLVVNPQNNFFLIGFRIMPGLCDDLLFWSFDRDVEFSLINQQTGGVHQTITWKCSRCPKSEKLQKPKDGTQNKPFYFYYFSLPIIPEVLQNDRIFIKFSSKPTEKNKH